MTTLLHDVQAVDYSSWTKVQLAAVIDRTAIPPAELPPTLKALYDARAKARKAAADADAQWSKAIAAAISDVPQGFTARIWDRYGDNITVARALPKVWAAWDAFRPGKTKRESAGIADKVRIVVAK